MSSEISYRELAPNELERVEEIDRTELITHIYYMRDGELVLEEERYDMKDWPPGRLPEIKEHLHSCLAEGGSAWGAFDGERLVGIGALDGRWYGGRGRTLDMYFLHVSDGYRHRGIGRKMVELAKGRAREMGAERLFVSGLPSLNTIRFYMSVGFDIAEDVDPRLYAREPEDIHMDLEL
ncbi:MAG: GNAT family N-acetyltransferase [Thermoplasmata archaeon]|nr:MAG: GNAT family N-acetyltransferase [Thermoplasmata archaeon]